MVSILHYKRFSLSLARIFSTIASSLKREREAISDKEKTQGQNIRFKLDQSWLQTSEEENCIIIFQMMMPLMIFYFLTEEELTAFTVFNKQFAMQKFSMIINANYIAQPPPGGGVVLHPPSSIILTSSTNSKVFDCITSLKSKRNTFYLQCDDEWSEEVQISSLSKSLNRERT